MNKDAIIDSTGKYRYSLVRIWDESKDGRLVFVMLNPSTADAEIDDPTIRRCIGFGKAWGFGRIEVINLFAFRATNPAELRRCPDPIGPQNNEYIESAVARATRIICAWGNHGSLQKRSESVIGYFPAEKTFCLGKSKTGQPKHPLYIRSDVDLIPFFERTDKG